MSSETSEGGLLYTVPGLSQPRVPSETFLRETTDEGAGRKGSVGSMSGTQNVFRCTKALSAHKAAISFIKVTSRVIVTGSADHVVKVRDVREGLVTS